MSPTTGESTIGMMIFSITPFHRTGAPAMSSAPTMPPNKACDDDDGRPRHQVRRFHVIAPTSAEATMSRPTAPVGGAIDALAHGRGDL